MKELYSTPISPSHWTSKIIKISKKNKEGTTFYIHLMDELIFLVRAYVYRNKIVLDDIWLEDDFRHQYLKTTYFDAVINRIGDMYDIEKVMVEVDKDNYDWIRAFKEAGFEKDKERGKYVWMVYYY